ncbi:alpha/beta hydrolase [Priestia koreensis]|uniref:Serine aminopeptidase S33 domain-containing protein n=1 Tax=Priestia koreensis TaxID=284581 RepID=A0A0M0L521_9BACI|nr:alpha/beta fold hydrolase [Priestia koreensis]KOO46171.1 hypothetical protein AMD01_09905 [Priestia koreensis]MCM3004216.1 alpha/beta fold hydrolase [Priestia koreensis]UNL83432.1 alpha/beta fold hydrolase [Priestia koreensis]
MTTYSIIQGAEPIFINGNETGVLVIHGFMGTPQSVEFLAQSFGEKGYTVYAPRLSGHGTHYKDLETYSFQDWIGDVTQAYRHLKKQCARVFVVGQSMGGALTSYLASKFSSISGIMLINPAISSIPCMEGYTTETCERYILEGAPDIKKPDVYEITYDYAPTASIKQLFSLMKFVRSSLSQITCPVISFASLEDHVVPATNTDYLLEQTRAVQKTKVTLRNSYHVASMDYEKELIAARCISFIRTICRSEALVFPTSIAQ